MEKPKFVYVSYIETTPEQLWEALTKPEFTRRYWFNSSIESSWKVGSAVHFRRDGEITDDQILLKFEPHRLLSYTFHPIFDEGMRNEKPSRVTFEIEALGENAEPRSKLVRLTVTHDDFPANSVVYPRITQGWPAVLSNLKSLLETGKTMDMSMMGCSAKTKEKPVAVAA